MLLTTGDIHLTDKPGEEYRHAFMDRFAAIAYKRQVRGIMILGDITQDKDRHPASLVNRVVSHIAKLAAIAPVWILEGNHDYANEGSPFFAFLSEIPNVEWVGKIKEWNNGPLKGCLALPHTRNHETEWKGVDMTGRNYIFCHNTFTGANVGFGRELGGIDLDVFPRGARVVSGDIHVPQQLGPVTYAGAPYTMNYGDDYKPRVLLLDRHAGVKSLGVSKFPQKRLIEVDDITELPTDLNHGDVCKVRVTIEDMGQWHSTKSAVYDWAQGMEIELYRCEPVIVKHAVRKRVKINEASETDDASVIKQYCKRMGADKGVASLGIEIMETGRDA